MSIPIPVIPYGSTETQEVPAVTPQNFLGGWVEKILQGAKDIWDRPIIGPTITKEEHQRMIRGEDTGPNNWTPGY